MVKKIKIKPFASIRGSKQHDIHTPLIKPPKLLRKTPKFSVSQLINLADQKRREAAKEIAVKTVNTMTLTKRGLFDPERTLTYRIQTYSKHNRHIHKVTVFCVDGVFDKDAKVVVDCSCSSHIFQCEYNLARRGNALLWRCNGEAPTQNLKLTICKHTYQALRTMFRMQKNGTLPKRTRITKKLSMLRG